MANEWELNLIIKYQKVSKQWRGKVHREAKLRKAAEETMFQQSQPQCLSELLWYG